MTSKLVLALAASAFTFAAQAQQPAAAPKATNADAQRVVKMISGDPEKAKAYCDMGKLGDELEAAQQKHDTKKADDLGKQLDALAAKLGPEWDTLMNGLQSVDESSAEGRAISVTLQSLDKLCAK